MRSPGRPREAETNHFFTPRSPRGRCNVFFFAPRRASKSAPQPTLYDFCGHLGRFKAEDAFQSHFGTKKARKWTPGTIKIKVFTWNVFKINGFHAFSN